MLLLICIASCNTKQPTIPVDNWTMQGFKKVDSLNPILTPSGEEKFTCPVTHQPVFWSEKNVLNPAAVVKDSKVYLLYRSQDSAMTSRIGLWL